AHKALAQAIAVTVIAKLQLPCVRGGKIRSLRKAQPRPGIITVLRAAGGVHVVCDRLNLAVIRGPVAISKIQHIARALRVPQGLDLEMVVVAELSLNSVSIVHSRS